METRKINRIQGYQLLALMGKRVLRPGGRKLTEKLISGLSINSRDQVIEFAPGKGWTAEKVLAHQPMSYKGIELSEEAALQLRKKLGGKNREIIIGNASKVPLPDQSTDKLYGEAMLTMHANQRKVRIMREAYRLLKKGGLYGVHELSLFPQDISDSRKKAIQKTLATTMHVNARPLTLSEWIVLFEQEGFKVKDYFTNPMAVLETRRIVEDEGILQSLKIGFNIYTNPAARRRIAAIRKVFKKYKNEMTAIVIIAEKI